METVTGEEDDGGDYEVLIFNYAQYKITIVHDMVDSIRISSPGYLWAKNIKIGSDRKLIKKHIATAPVVDEVDASQYLVCSNAGDIYAIFHYQKK